MIKLEKEFTENADGTGTQTFKLIKRTEKVAMYQRITKDGKTFAYEVFRIKIIKAGSSFPNGMKITEDFESYGNKGKKRFNKYSLYCCKNLNRAEEHYAKLNKEEDAELPDTDDDDLTPSVNGESDGGKRGPKAKNVKMPIPKKGEKFTMKKLMLWSGESQPTLYIRLKPLIEQGLVSIVGEVREAHTRGKAQILYCSNTDAFAVDIHSEKTMV